MEELDLRHEELEEAGNCRCMVTGTSTRATTMASIHIPPWPGGDSLRRGVLGSGCADHPPVHTRQTHNPAPGTGHEHHEHETQEPVAGVHPPPLFEQARSRRRRARVRPPAASAICGTRSTARCGMTSVEVILGTSITCSGTMVSQGLSTSTSWNTECGTGASRICTMGAISASCSMVRRWIRSCGPGGSARLAGRPPPGSSSYRLKSTRRSRPELGRVLRLALLLPGPGLPLSS